MRGRSSALNSEIPEVLTHDYHGLRQWFDRFTAFEHRLALRFNRPNCRRLCSISFAEISR